MSSCQPTNLPHPPMDECLYEKIKKAAEYLKVVENIDTFLKESHGDVFRRVVLLTDCHNYDVPYELSDVIADSIINQLKDKKAELELTINEMFSNISDNTNSIPSTDAVYGVLAWLTTQEEIITLSKYHDSTIAAKAAAAFIESNKLPAPSKHYPNNLIYSCDSWNRNHKIDSCENLCCSTGRAC